MKKDIVVFWGKEHYKNKPLNYGVKEQTYYDFLKALNKVANIFLCFGFNNYLGQNKYKCSLKYIDIQLMPCDEVIQPYRVFDRSGKTSYPEFSSVNVFNNLKFKIFCKDKWLNYLKFREYFTETFLIVTKEDFEKYSQIVKTDNFILKPTQGLKGKGVELLSKGKKKDFEVNFFESETQVLQEFMDTSVGIPNIVEGKHDLRVVMLDNQILWSHVRQPKAGDFKANVAEGGSINDIAISKIPESIKSIAFEISKTFYKEFDNPLFSIDFGMTEDGPKIFEFNSQMGFPRPNMKDKNLFIEKLVESLVD